MVKVRGRNSNGKTVKQTVKNGQKISGDDAARPAWVMVPGVSSSRLRPDSDQSRIWCRARPWLVCDSLNELTWGQLCGTLTSDNLFFFFFFFFFVVSWVLFDFFFFLRAGRSVKKPVRKHQKRSVCKRETRQWQSTECDARYMVQRKKFDVILRLLVDRYRRTKPPKPYASQTDSLFQRDFQNR